MEVLYGNQPNLDDLRIIGCLCYAHAVGQSDKFAPRATKCVLLAYTFGLKGYKLYDIDNKKIFHSRDVIFQGKVFPYKNTLVTVTTPTEPPSYDTLFPPHIGPYTSDSPVQSLQPHSEVVLDTFSINTSPQVLTSHAPNSSPINPLSQSLNTPSSFPDTSASSQLRMHLSLIHI